ncbi:hypothetical protein J6590_101667, partial [Homalodisca vitripennis]
GRCSLPGAGYRRRASSRDVVVQRAGSGEGVEVVVSSGRRRCRDHWLSLRVFNRPSLYRFARSREWGKPSPLAVIGGEAAISVRARTCQIASDSSGLRRLWQELRHHNCCPRPSPSPHPPPSSPLAAISQSSTFSYAFIDTVNENIPLRHSGKSNLILRNIPGRIQYCRYRFAAATDTLSFSQIQCRWGGGVWAGVIHHFNGKGGVWKCEITDVRSVEKGVCE